jgi:hypothetical protein
VEQSHQRNCADGIYFIGRKIRGWAGVNSEISK